MLNNTRNPAKAEKQVVIRMMNLFTIEADGEIHEELMAKKGYYYRLWMRQFEEDAVKQVLA